MALYTKEFLSETGGYPQVVQGADTTIHTLAVDGANTLKDEVWLLCHNPGTTSADVTVTFSRSGSSDRNVTKTVAAKTTVNLLEGWLIEEGVSISVRDDSNNTIITDNLLFVSYGTNIEVVDASTSNLIATLAIGSTVNDMAVDNTNGILYVATASEIKRFAISTLNEQAAYAVAGGTKVAVDPTLGYFYIYDNSGPNWRSVNIADDSLLHTQATSGSTNKIFADTENQYLLTVDVDGTARTYNPADGTIIASRTGISNYRSSVFIPSSGTLAWLDTAGQVSGATFNGSTWGSVNGFYATGNQCFNLSADTETGRLVLITQNGTISIYNTSFVLVNTITPNYNDGRFASQTAKVPSTYNESQGRVVAMVEETLFQVDANTPTDYCFVADRLDLSSLSGIFVYVEAFAKVVSVQSVANEYLFMDEDGNTSTGTFQSVALASNFAFFEDTQEDRIIMMHNNNSGATEINGLIYFDVSGGDVTALASGTSTSDLNDDTLDYVSSITPIDATRLAVCKGTRVYIVNRSTLAVTATYNVGQECGAAVYDATDDLLYIAGSNGTGELTFYALDPDDGTTTTIAVSASLDFDGFPSGYYGKGKFDETNGIYYAILETDGNLVGINYKTGATAYTADPTILVAVATTRIAAVESASVVYLSDSNLDIIAAYSLDLQTRYWSVDALGLHAGTITRDSVNNRAIISLADEAWFLNSNLGSNYTHQVSTVSGVVYANSAASGVPVVSGWANRVTG